MKMETKHCANFLKTIWCSAKNEWRLSQKRFDVSQKTNYQSKSSSSVSNRAFRSCFFESLGLDEDSSFWFKLLTETGGESVTELGGDMRGVEGLDGDGPLGVLVAVLNILPSKELSA